MNISGTLIVVIGVILIIMALKNTQGALFPGLFPSSGTGSNPPVVGPGGTGIAGLGCPPCYHPYTYLGVQWCMLDSVQCLLSNNMPTTGVQSIIPMPGESANIPTPNVPTKVN
jgi:hypothetical protein